MKIFQKGFNYSQDGPGNRLVYHLKGCNMRCPWCSNPEGMYAHIGECFSLSPQELVAEALSAKPMFFDGGGVTFTGGEATVQAEELAEALRGLKKNGINTAIETNGTYRDLPKLFDQIDYLMIDFKHPSSARHEQVTGVPNTVIAQNIRAAVDQAANLLVRIPLIGGFNNDDESVQGFLAFFEDLHAKRLCVELLPYHEYGKDKWAKCGLVYQMDKAAVTEAERRTFEARLREIGIQVIRT